MLYIVSEVFGTNIDGMLLCHFRVPSKDETVYFLFDAYTGFIIKCSPNGKPMLGHRWEDIYPQEFVSRHWGGFVSGFSKIHVLGRSLRDLEGDYMSYPRIS